VWHGRASRRHGGSTRAPDVCLIDQGLPDGGGPLVRRAHRAAAPLIMMTGCSTSARFRAMALGA
jgi:DNA-binding response OmpR family regulator